MTLESPNGGETLESPNGGDPNLEILRHFWDEYIKYSVDLIFAKIPDSLTEIRDSLTEIRDSQRIALYLQRIASHLPSIITQRIIQRTDLYLPSTREPNVSIYRFYYNDTGEFKILDLIDFHEKNQVITLKFKFDSDGNLEKHPNSEHPNSDYSKQRVEELYKIFSDAVQQNGARISTDEDPESEYCKYAWQGEWYDKQSHDQVRSPSSPDSPDKI